jgi:hypothetical protein
MLEAFFFYLTPFMPFQLMLLFLLLSSSFALHPFQLNFLLVLSPLLLYTNFFSIMTLDAKLEIARASTRE